jgi:hypothetical protein
MRGGAEGAFRNGIRSLPPAYGAIPRKWVMVRCRSGRKLWNRTNRTGLFRVEETDGDMGLGNETVFSFPPGCRVQRACPLPGFGAGPKGRGVKA